MLIIIVKINSDMVATLSIKVAFLAMALLASTVVRASTQDLGQIKLAKMREMQDKSSEGVIDLSRNEYQ